MYLLNVSEIDNAYERIQSLIIKTPLIINETINEITGANVYFKLENLQITGSFKIRGAINKISQLSNDDKNRGIVAYSSGNHAQAVAYASKIYNTHATIVMPKNAPLIKIKNTKNFGAKVILYDEATTTREKLAFEIANKENKKIVKPYDDLEIIAGQGTVGKEISETLIAQKIKPDIYLCCCGGGGLIAGSSFYLKSIFPDLRSFAVEPIDFNDTQISLINNIRVKNSKKSRSICDALLAPQPGEITFEINKKTLNGGLTVSDDEVMSTIIKLGENIKVIIEPGGAVAASALLTNKINVKNKNVVVMISGGNIDYKLFSRIINKNNE